MTGINTEPEGTGFRYITKLYVDDSNSQWHTSILHYMILVFYTDYVSS